MKRNSKIEPNGQERFFWEKLYDQHLKKIKNIHTRSNQLNNIEGETMKRQINANEKKAKSTLFYQKETLIKISHDNLNLMKKIQDIETRKQEQLQSSVKSYSLENSDRLGSIQLPTHQLKRQKIIANQNNQLRQRLYDQKSTFNLLIPHKIHLDHKLTHRDQITKRIEVLEKHIYG